MEAFITGGPLYGNGGCSLKRRFHVADDASIKAGAVTDIYYRRTRDIVTRKGLADQRVVMDVHAYSLPPLYDWAVLAGIEEVARLFEGVDVTVSAMREGTVFHRYEPVLRVEGAYGAFGVLESAVLGLLRQASAIATRAARCKKAAQDKDVIFFGIRALHPAITPMADRAAFIGGCDAVSGTYGAALIGEEPVGTMPHELVLLFGDQVEAWKAFDEVVSDEVPRIVLCDIWFDETVEALLAATTLGKKLYGVRFDTPATRRGDMRRIVEEARWILRLNEFGHVKIVVSSGVHEDRIAHLRDVVDAFGVGTAIACPPSIDLAFDIVETKGQAIAKKGKLPGRKEVYRCTTCHRHQLVPALERVAQCPVCGGPVERLLKPLLERGHLVAELPAPRAIRRYVLDQLAAVELRLNPSN
jgi:nicotinate phosphoribosyltransferase